MDFLSNLLAGIGNVAKPVEQTVGNFGQNLLQGITQPRIISPVPQQQTMAPQISPLQSFENGVGNFANGVVKNVGNYFNPNMVGSADNPTPNFWTTPIAQGLAKIQQFDQNAPRFNFSQDLTQGIQNPIQKFGAQLALSVPESILNVPSDILRSGSQLGTDFRTGQLAQPGTAIRDVSAAALPLLTIGTLGGGTVAKGIAENVGKDVGYQALWDAVKEGAGTGLKYGAGFGALQGLSSSNDIPTQLINAVKQETIGAALGTVMGGVTGGASNRIGAIKNLLDRSPQVDAQLRDARGRYTAGETPVKPQGMSTKQWEFQIAFNDKYKRNPYTPVYPTDLANAVKYETGKVGVGLSIRDVSKDRNPLGTSEASSKISANGEQPQINPKTIEQPQLQQSAQLLNPSQKTANFQTIPNQVNSSDQSVSYLNDLIKKQNEARQGESLGIGQKIGQFYGKLKEQLIDSNAPIEDVLNNAEKQGKFNVLPTKDVRLQIDRALRSTTLAGQFAKDNGLVDVIKQAPDLQALDQYMIAKQAATVAKNGIETGRDLEKDQQLIKDLAPTYEPLAQKVNQYSRKLLQYSVDSGLISKDMADQLVKKYPEYVPLNRIFSEDELATQTPRGTGKGVASLSKQTVVQKLEGSKREIENPVASLLTKTQTAFDQGERNIAAQQLASYKDLPGNPFQITPLRTAENVNKRIDLYSQAADLKPVQNKLASLLQTRQKWVRQLTSQIDNLNKQGLYKSLKQKFTENPVIQSSINQANTYKKNLVDIGTDKFYAPERNPNIKLKQNYAIPTKSQFKDIINNLVNLPSSEINAIKSKIATRENNLAPIMDKIASLSDDLHGIKQYRGGLIDEARMLADAESRGKSTISVLNNGVKEIYETTPEIAAAAKSLNKEQMGLLAKIVSVPTRILRLGATGLNYPFAFANLVKDQSSSFINSKNALATQNPIAFTKGLFAALGHGKLYDEVVRNAAGGTSFDIGRDNPNLSISKIRNSGNVVGKTINVIKNPIRTVEDLIGRTEELTRAQQYHGMYNALIKQGRTPQDAAFLAAKSARENTVNFARGGTFSKVLNWIIPYFNAGVQGSRTFVRNVQTRPAQTLTKFAVGVGMPVAAATAWNLSDPQRRAAYNDIPEYEKQNSIIIVPPNPTKNADGTWNVLKIPMSQEIAALGTLVRRPIEQAQGLDPVKFGEIANSLLQTETSLNTQSPTGLISSLTPQIAKPGVEAVTNTNLFTGQKIVPDYLKNLPADQQVKKGTSGTARIIAKPLGISPLTVQNEAQTVLGGLGPQLLNTSDTLLNKAGVIPNNQVSTKGVGNALAKRFFQASGGNTANQLDQQLSQGLNPKETQAYSLLHTPRAVDAQGNPIQDNSILNSQQKAITYLNYPKLQAVDAIKEQQNPNHDPIWDLPPTERNIVFASRVQLPGQKNTYDSYLNQQPWYKDFLQKQTNYFNSLPPSANTQTQGGLQRPQPSSYVQSQMDAKNWKDPQVQAYLNANTDYNNSLLASLGLPGVSGTSGFGYKKISFPKITGSIKPIHVAAVKINNYTPASVKAPVRPSIVRFKPQIRPVRKTAF